MAKKKLVNAETDRNVNAFLDAVQNQKRKEDAFKLLDIVKAVTSIEPKIWGVSIIGFGKYSYQRKSGDEFEWFRVGFSPAKAHLSVYLMFDMEKEPLMDELGPHKKGKGCLYIKKLEDVNEEVLRKLIRKSYNLKRG